MKKIKLLTLPLVAALCLGGTACTPSAVNEAPEITGVTDKMCAVGAVYDLLDNIAALDKEDGDLTPKLEITIDGKPVEGFYTVFDEETDYEVNYKVTDSNGQVAEETAVISALSRDVYKAFDLVDFDGFEVKTAGNAKKGSESLIGDGANSKYTFKVTGAAENEDAVFSREYSFKSGTDYTVKYYLKSNVAGTIKAKINGGEAVDLAVVEGDNVLTLNYSVPDGEQEKTDVKIDLLFGGLGADIEWTFDKVVAEYEDDSVQEDDGGVKQIEFTNANVEARIDNDGGKSDLEGSVEVANDNSSATLKITTVCSYGDRWRGGMFIKTGVALEAGKTYKVSFNTQAANSDPYDVCILRNQWGPDEFVETIESPANGKVEKSVTITEDTKGELLLYVRSGDHVNEITISDLKVTVPVSDKFKFTNANVEARIDNDDGKSDLEGSVEVADDNSSATLKITTVCSYGDRWRGGMFIKTGVALEAGKTYKVSFNTQAANSDPYDVCILRNQWGPKEFIETIESPANGKVEKSITITEDTKGELWLYVRSGDHVNEITISDLKVELPETGTEPETPRMISETFTCKNLFKMFAYEGATNYVQWIDGKLVFEVEKFSDTDWHNKIEGPQFFVDTAGVEFMISFKAKATSPVLVTWVGPKSGGWDPNLIWRQFNLSETEQVYTFKGNESDSSNHNFEWQFGFSANKKYENVTIEISDIVIYWQNVILDD